jgi:hypothetical protein
VPARLRDGRRNIGGNLNGERARMGRLALPDGRYTDASGDPPHSRYRGCGSAPFLSERKKARQRPTSRFREAVQTKDRETVQSGISRVDR